MKIIQIFIILFIITINLQAQSFKIYNNDTINYSDASGLKQGEWIYFLNDEISISQKGKYINSKKEGIWLSYYDNGNIKSSITYIKNKQDGYAIIYYENGTKSEEGLWKENRWVGEYKYYYDNGNPAYVWNFNDEGNRTGNQQYFYETGKLKIEGKWESGKEQGIITEYYSNGNLKTVSDYNAGIADGSKKEYFATGELKSEKKYTNGILDESSVVYYSSTDNTNVEIDVEDTVNTTVAEKDTNAALFTGSGYNKLYNKSQLLEQEGDFKSGYLYDGKKYYYYSEGTLIKTEIYQAGKITETIKEK